MVIPAIEYITNGFSIIPLSRTSKRPIGEWKEYQKKVADVPTIMRWFRGKSLNIAVVCGKISGNLIVIDFDDPDYYIDNAWLLKDFPVVKTSKGYHVYVRTIEENNYRNIKLIVDKKRVKAEIRATGGYVAAPPSVHGNGLYTTIHKSILSTPSIPKEGLANILREISGRVIPEKKAGLKVSYNGYANSSDTIEVGSISNFVGIKINNNTSAIRNAYHGNRNNQLFQSACFLGELVPNGYVDLDEITDILLEAAIESGLIDDDGIDSVSQTIISGLTRGMKKPVKLIEDDLLSELL